MLSKLDREASRSPALPSRQHKCQVLRRWAPTWGLLPSEGRAMQGHVDRSLSAGVT